MSLHDLDPVLQPPKRLAALGVLDVAARVDFGFLRDHLDLSDSDLSKQLKALADAGYVTSTKTGRGSRRRAWFSITPDGSRALAAHAAALRALIDPVDILGERSNSEMAERRAPDTKIGFGPATGPAHA